MDREITYYRNEQCDECGRFGAFDFFGDLICPECLDELNSVSMVDDEILHAAGEGRYVDKRASDLH